MEKNRSGFTLIELMMVVAVIAILAAVAYPAYTEQVKRAHRSDIAGVLSEQAQRLERYYSQQGTYSNAPGLSAGNGHYRITATLNSQDFTLIASATGAMMSSDKCGGFSLTHTGARANPGAAAGLTLRDCWGR